MALVPCKSCGEMISDQATTCPKCGAPVNPTVEAVVEEVVRPTVDTTKVDMFMTVHGKEFPEAQLPYIRERLLAMDDNKLNQINMLQFKSPTTMLIISIFLGTYGIDRFMLGDTGLGVAKLLTAGGCGIWTIIDWFSISDKTREYNFAKLQQML